MNQTTILGPQSHALPLWAYIMLAALFLFAVFWPFMLAVMAWTIIESRKAMRKIRKKIEEAK